MNKGVWMGKQAEKYGILVLGESHYGDRPEDLGKLGTDDTSGVVEWYLKGNGGHWRSFFIRIAESFGYSDDLRRDFYDKVYFGNYVDRLCGKSGDNTAAKIIACYRQEYNDQLFTYINEHEIRYLVCFSKRVYWNLPEKTERASGETSKGYSAGKIKSGEKWQNNWIEMGTYRHSMEHPFTKVILKNDLTVYGIRHPSCQGGYVVSQVYDFLKLQDGIDCIMR
ncbi:hypothetical protein [uncultured Dialister sp.]|uniref:hypothetical protein n=1 Tax=uncultured Dialister sp. TaxID=278064 RepID=UPI0025F0F141|nr:hypothetical protein [uncultured Dialister sp.]